MSSNSHTYIMINASNEGICVDTTLVYLLSNCWQVLNIFKD